MTLSGAPFNVECGDVFRIQNRVGDVVASRKLAGSIATTTEAHDRRRCGVSAGYMEQITDDLYLAVCPHHIHD